ncbi:MAG: acyl--CoA ligase [Syntrophales bacterium]|jgi:acyl-CoA synthetase (AMP-forming)/AMP-acid ligase II|nr:acyl--CoA ligase [Syntrophales bacterium]MDY0045108.1 class I adenylate-forming enzyme family protein [Syntrophales bacterium]
MYSLEKMTIGNLFKRNLRLFPEKTIQVLEDGKRQTYREIDERTNRLANGLLSLGLRKGDHVAIMAMNCLEYMEYQLATAKIGIVSVLINHLAPKDRILYMLENSDSKAIIFESRYLNSLLAYRENLLKLKNYIIIRREQETKNIKDLIDYEYLIEKSPDTEINADVNIYDPNSIIFTTGTTGHPKAVRKSMAADLYHSIGSVIYYPNYDATFKLGLPAYTHLVSLLVPPQFHLGGQAVTLRPLILPGTIVLMSTFDPENFLRLIDREKINTSWVQPAMLYKIKNLPDEIITKYDRSSLITIICGSTSLKEKERKALESFFFNARLGSCYAATEFGIVSYVTSEELTATRPENLGLPVFSADIKIAGKDGAELPRNEIGEIWVRSPALPINCEYYKDEESTEKGFKDGWAIVGDMGWQDEKGYIYYYGRSDDIIMTGGEKVSPLSIEEVIQQNQKVDTVVVIGMPDEKWQEAVTAAVIPIKGTNLSQQEIMDFCRGKVANYEIPKKVYIVNELPIGPTGKLDRKALKKILLQK